jgi:hypothetical protein
MKESPNQGLKGFPAKAHIFYLEQNASTAPGSCRTNPARAGPGDSREATVTHHGPSPVGSSCPLQSRLALGGVYHLLRGAIPNNPTLRTAIANGPIRQRLLAFHQLWANHNQEGSRCPAVGYMAAVPNATTSNWATQRNSAMSCFHFTRRYCGTELVVTMAIFL